MSNSIYQEALMRLKKKYLKEYNKLLDEIRAERGIIKKNTGSQSVLLSSGVQAEVFRLLKSNHPERFLHHLDITKSKYGSTPRAHTEALRRLSYEFKSETNELREKCKKELKELNEFLVRKRSEQ